MSTCCTTDCTGIVVSDASNVGVGAVLSQIQGNEERVIAYYSKALAPPKEELLCHQEGAASPGESRESFPNIPTWTTLQNKDEPYFVLMGGHNIGTIQPSSQIA